MPAPRRIAPLRCYLLCDVTCCAVLIFTVVLLKYFSGCTCYCHSYCYCCCCCSCCNCCCCCCCRQLTKQYVVLNYVVDRITKKERPLDREKESNNNTTTTCSAVESSSQAGRQTNPTLDDIYRRYIYLYDALCETDSFFTMF